MRDFKPGDEVITFQTIQALNKWTPAKMMTEIGTVMMVNAGKVWVDTMFGVVPFNSENVEWADLPF